MTFSHLRVQKIWDPPHNSVNSMLALEIVSNLLALDVSLPPPDTTYSRIVETFVIQH